MKTSIFFLGKGKQDIGKGDRLSSVDKIFLDCTDVNADGENH